MPDDRLARTRRAYDPKNEPEPRIPFWFFDEVEDFVTRVRRCEMSAMDAIDCLSCTFDDLYEDDHIAPRHAWSNWAPAQRTGDEVI